MTESPSRKIICTDTPDIAVRDANGKLIGSIDCNRRQIAPVYTGVKKPINAEVLHFFDEHRSIIEGTISGNETKELDEQREALESNADDLLCAMRDLERAVKKRKNVVLGMMEDSQEMMQAYQKCDQIESMATEISSKIKEKGVNYFIANGGECNIQGAVEDLDKLFGELIVKEEGGDPVHDSNDERNKIDREKSGLFGENVKDTNYATVDRIWESQKLVEIDNMLSSQNPDIEAIKSKISKFLVGMRHGQSNLASHEKMIVGETYANGKASIDRYVEKYNGRPLDQLELLTKSAAIGIRLSVVNTVTKTEIEKFSELVQLGERVRWDAKEAILA